MLRDFAKAKRPAAWEACDLSLGKRCLGKENARGNDAESGPRFNHGPRWPQIDRIPVRLKQSLEDLSRGFVV